MVPLICCLRLCSRATGGHWRDVVRATVAAPRGPRVAHGLDDAPANTNARRAQRAAGER